MSQLGQSLLMFALLSIMPGIMIGVSLHVKNQWRKKTEAERYSVMGKIADTAKKVNTAPRVRGSRVYYVPVIEYAVGDRVYHLEYENGDRDREKFVIGQPVEVLCDADRPEKFHLAQDHAVEEGANRLIRQFAILWIVFALLTLADARFHFLVS